MQMQPPELLKPFVNAEERDRARALMLKRDAILRTIESLANRTFDEWPASAKMKLPRQTNGVPEDPKRRIERWTTLFAEEINQIHNLAHLSRLSDVELRQGLYLAERLLSTVTNLDPNKVDEFAI